MFQMTPRAEGEVEGLLLNIMDLFICLYLNPASVSLSTGQYQAKPRGNHLIGAEPSSAKAFPK